MSVFRSFSKIIFISLLLFSFSCFSPKSSPPNTLSPEKFFFDKDDSLTATDIFQKREIVQYDQGGYFICRTRKFTEPDPVIGEKAVRDFIWQHWTEKKRGYIKLACPGVDVERTTHYFIEPNEKGEWNVLCKTITKLSNNQFLSSEEVFNSIERTLNDSSDNWILSFKSIDGEVKHKLPIW